MVAYDALSGEIDGRNVERTCRPPNQTHEVRSSRTWPDEEEPDPQAERAGEACRTEYGPDPVQTGTFQALVRWSKVGCLSAD